MKSLFAAGCIATSLLAAAPAFAQVDVGSGLVGAGVGAAIGGAAGGGRGAATGAIVGGAVGATTDTFAPGPAYARPYGPAGCRWVPPHRNSYGEFRPGHCAYQRATALTKKPEAFAFPFPSSPGLSRGSPWMAGP